jgi:hypothetical protein
VVDLSKSITGEAVVVWSGFTPPCQDTCAKLIEQIKIKKEESIFFIAYSL